MKNYHTMMTNAIVFSKISDGQGCLATERPVQFVKNYGTMNSALQQKNIM